MMLPRFVVAALLLVTPLVGAQETHVVICDSKGLCKAGSDEDLTKPYDHAWVWSADCAIHRTSPHEKSPQCGSSALASFTVGSIRRNEHVRIISAPAEMWREVDEAFLPRYPLPVDKREVRLLVEKKSAWRIRAISDTRGSWWCTARDSRRGCRVDLFDAGDHSLQILDGRGSAVHDASASVVEQSSTRRRADVLGVRRGSDKGVLRFEHMPDVDGVSLVISADGFAPQLVRARAGRLPDEIRMARGSSIDGRVTTTQRARAHVPVAAAGVAFECWLEGAPVLFRRSVLTKEDGTFSIAALPRTAGVLTVRARGLAIWQRDLNTTTTEGEPVSVELVPESDIRARVLDDKGEPIPGARVESADTTTTADEKGFARVSAATDRAPVTLKVTDSCCIGKSITANAPVPKVIPVVLRRAFHVLASVVRSGQPVDGGDVVIHTGSTETLSQLTSDGTLSLAVSPDEPFELEIQTASTVPYRIRVDGGRPGEKRNLGTIELSDGVVVRGTIVSRVDGAVVAGAHVWAPRSIAEGPLVAWMRGQLVETTSDADGVFELRGFTAVPSLLRVDAPGEAREFVTPACDAVPCDVGTVRIGAGATVVVECGSRDDSPVAHLDTRGDGLDLDDVTAPVVSGVARFEHIPSGRLLLKVMSGRTALCTRDLDVAGDLTRVDAKCTAHTLRVSGSVTAGGQPVQSGSLVWSSASESHVHGAIMTRISPAGSRQQDAYGVGSSSVVVAVMNGGFSTDDLSPGLWNAMWTSDGSVTTAKQVQIPDVDAYAVALDYPGGVFAGHVVDRNGGRVARAAVREIGSGAVAITRADGTFRILLASGAHRLQAEADGQRSEVATVNTDQVNGDTPEVVLHLGAMEATIQLDVLLDQSPVANAFVLAESSAGTTTVLMTDASGHAALERGDGPQQVRFAVHAGVIWFFGDWNRQDDLPAQVIIPLRSDVGSIRVVSRDPQDRMAPPLIEPHGWDVMRALASLGIAPRLPLIIQGLPVGMYTAGGQTVTVERGAEQTIQLN